jgi:hypothetical protein
MPERASPPVAPNKHVAGADAVRGFAALAEAFGKQAQLALREQLARHRVVDVDHLDGRSAAARGRLVDLLAARSAGRKGDAAGHQRGGEQKGGCCRAETNGHVIHFLP